MVGVEQRRQKSPLKSAKFSPSLAHVWPMSAEFGPICFSTVRTDSPRWLLRWWLPGPRQASCGASRGGGLPSLRTNSSPSCGGGAACPRNVRTGTPPPGSPAWPRVGFFGAVSPSAAGAVLAAAGCRLRRGGVVACVREGEALPVLTARRLGPRTAGKGGKGERGKGGARARAPTPARGGKG